MSLLWVLVPSLSPHDVMEASGYWPSFVLELCRSCVMMGTPVWFSLGSSGPGAALGCWGLRGRLAQHIPQCELVSRSCCLM